MDFHITIPALVIIMIIVFLALSALIGLIFLELKNRVSGRKRQSKTKDNLSDRITQNTWNDIHTNISSNCNSSSNNNCSSSSDGSFD